VGADVVYREDVAYSVIVDAPLFVAYSLPGTLALLLTAAGLLGVLSLLGPSAGRSRTVGRVLACAALALAALSLAGVGALFDPVFTAAWIFGTLAPGAAAVLASHGAHRAGAGSGWVLGLLAQGLLGLFLLPLWPLVYAVGLLPAVLGCALMLLGVVVEFCVAGGVNTGAWTGSLVGWLVFLLGYAATAAGLVVFGVAAGRRVLLERWSGLPLVTGVVGLLWPFLSEVWIVLNVLIQLLFGLGWMALGSFLLTQKRRGSASERFAT
jgi:hypothetical protein